MSARRVSKDAAPPLPPLLLRVIHAARHAPFDPVDRAGHDAVLYELGRWALVYVPSRGVLAPCEDDAYKVIEDVGRRHLQYGKARAAWSKALRAIESVEQRNEVERA
jgi:hypothetical protein